MSSRTFSVRLITVGVVFAFNCIWAVPQEREFKIHFPQPDPFAEASKTTRKYEFRGTQKLPVDTAAKYVPAFKTVQAVTGEFVQFPDENVKPPAKETLEERFARFESDNRFDWQPAILESLFFLGIQHGFRFTEKKTRAELDGPFFRDWKESVQNLEGWDDGGKVFTNYIAHPMQGAMTGRIFINNSGVGRRQEFGRSKEYWVSRLKSMGWSAVWSAQFEIGPISEASLGNVGQTRHENGKSKLTYLDLVITPTVGTGFVIIEDAIDKYVLKNWLEPKITCRLLKKIVRSVLTPTTSFANLVRFRGPWWRDMRDN
jgi:hypothetical protein